jgi:hypothetical protein
MLRFYPDKTKVIFFDLEYYVPKDDRLRRNHGGLAFSPALPGHKIIGGIFRTYYPMQNREESLQSFWEWEMGSESAVLKAIYNHLEKEWRTSQGQTGGLMLAGIGISHSDVPALLARMTECQIAPMHKIYDTLCGCRQIDLSVATFCQFSFNQEYFSFPKTKSSLYQKYLPEKKMGSGTGVWDLYDTKDYEAIERRCMQEVEDMLKIYKTMVDLRKQQDRDLKRLKKIDRLDSGPARPCDGDGTVLTCLQDNSE